MKPVPALAEGFPDLSGMRVAREPHWFRWLSAALIVLVLAVIVRAFAGGQIEWSYVSRLRQGRIDAAAQGNETLPYIMDLEPGAYAPVGEPIAQQFTGIALPVKEKALQQAILEAVDALIADGTYKTLLAKWKLNDNGLEKATINAGQ
ncbi:ABC-type amino acid transport substrate-binding protein [Bradyrhizobium sp. JR7.2]